MTHPETEWPSQQNILCFCFFLFHYLFVPFADTNSAEPFPESLPLGSFMFVQRAKRSKNLYLNHNTAFAKSAN